MLNRDDERGGTEIWGRLINAARDGFEVYDAELRYVALNAPAAALCGRSVGEIIGKTRRDIYGEGDRLEAQIRAAFDRDEPVCIRHEETTAGTAKLYETTFRAVHEETGGARYVIGLSRERGPAISVVDGGTLYDELSLVSELLRSHNENSPLGVIQWDVRRRVTYWSRRAQELLGWSFAEAIGRTYRELDLAADRGGAGDPDDMLRRIWSGEQRAAITHTKNRARDGRTVYCRWFNSLVEASGSLSVLSLLEDISASVEAEAALEESEQRYRSLFDQNPNAVIAVDCAGRITAANETASMLFGERHGSVTGSHFTRWTKPAEVAAYETVFRRALAGEAHKHDGTVVRTDGSERDVSITTMPIVKDGAVGGVYVVANDITERKRAERALAMQSERIRRLYLVAASNDSPERQITAALALGCELFGFEIGALFNMSGHGCIEFETSRDENDAGVHFPPDMCRMPLGSGEVVAIAERAEEKYAALSVPAPHAIEAYVGAPIDVLGVRYGTLNFGSTRAARTPFPATDRDLLQLMAALIAGALERRQSRAHLKTLAYYDALTGLPNRVLFRERVTAALDAAQADGRRLSVFFLDLDHFKDINDTLGHALGDRLLSIVAKRLLGCVRPSDTVARMGGDEFTILLADVAGPQSASDVGERILQAIDAPIAIGGVEHYITTSIGIAMFPDDGRDVDTLLKNADSAMYRSKDIGRNTFQYFTPGLSAATTARISQERSLHNALERGEFRIYYQPQIEVATGKLLGVEALVRWQHPRLGLVPPNTFIPSAELSGLIVPLGDWILSEACAQVRGWQRDLFPGLHLAVNLSARQFHQLGLASRIVQVLAQSELEPTSLELEITEGVAMHDAASSIDIMRELRAAGVRLSVDDFGTGYSSLAYLRRFPLNTLKIDKSFVTDVIEHPDDMMIVRTVIAMAHSLGLDVVAEGVETRAQFDLLRAEGCDRVQGFLFSRALSPVDFESYVTSGRIRAETAELGLGGC